MDFYQFLDAVYAIRPNLSGTAARIVHKWIDEEKIDFDGQSDFKRFVKNIREDSFDQLQDYFEFDLQTEDELRTYFNEHFDEKFFVGKIDDTVVYVLQPQIEERW